MHRKKKSGLETKTHMTVSLIKKIVLVMALLGIFTATGNAGAINPFLKNSGEYIQNIDIGGDTFEINNRSQDSDTWDSDFHGFTGDDYLGGPDENDLTHPTYYIGSFKNLNNNNGGGDSPEVLKELIKHFLGEDISFWGYSKYEDGSITETEGYSLTVTFPTVAEDDDNEIVSGSWEVNSSSDQSETINFYSVAGGHEFALYWVNPEQSSGTWTTAHLENPGGQVAALSHFSVMKTSNTTPGSTDPAPEPATMLLFGFSLIGLAGMARRKNSKF